MSIVSWNRSGGWKIYQNMGNFLVNSKDQSSKITGMKMFDFVDGCKKGRLVLAVAKILHLLIVDMVENPVFFVFEYCT